MTVFLIIIAIILAIAAFVVYACIVGYVRICRADYERALKANGWDVL